MIWRWVKTSFYGFVLCTIMLCVVLFVLWPNGWKASDESPGAIVEPTFIYAYAEKIKGFLNVPIVESVKVEPFVDEKPNFISDFEKKLRTHFPIMFPQSQD